MSLILRRRNREVRHEQELYPLLMAILQDMFRGYKVLYQHRAVGGIPDFLVYMYTGSMPVEVKTYVSERDAEQLEKYGGGCIAVPEDKLRYAERWFDCIILIPVRVVRRREKAVGDRDEDKEVVEGSDEQDVRG
ncbi:MAG: hypothetical protein RXR06_05945 [Thermoproteus sp.]